MKRYQYLLTLLAVLVTGFELFAQDSSGGDVLVSLGQPYAKKKKVLQELDIQHAESVNVTIRVSCYQLREKDSSHLYDLTFEDVFFKKGISTVKLDLEDFDSKAHLSASFIAALKKADYLLPGQYVTSLTMDGEGIAVNRSFLWTVDSNISYNTGLRRRMNEVFEDKKQSARSRVSKSTSKRGRNTPKSLSQPDLERTTLKVNKKLRYTKGVKATPKMIAGESYNELSYEGWFLGRYKVVAGKSMKERVAAEKAGLDKNPGLMMTNDIDDFTSLKSQFKKLGKRNGKGQEVAGNVDASSVLSSGQEPGSEQENSYQEIKGEIKTKVKDLPVVLEGYYTTQDNKREAKASYLRVRYDIESAKGELRQKINNYKAKFNETKSRGTNLESLFKRVIAKTRTEQQKLTDELSRDMGVDKNLLGKNNADIDGLIPDVDTSGMLSKGIGKVDSNGKREKILAKRAAAKEKYKQIQDCQKKIDKYETLIRQYKEQLYFDSAMVYRKIDKLLQDDDVSYKKMYKGAKEILPSDKGSKVASGLTKFEVGLLNQYETRYTMAGQSLTGISAGYDLGFVEASVAGGRTQYISRDGSIDKYNCGMARIDFRPVSRQKVGLVYYSYTPTKQIFASNNFIKTDLGVPSTVNPVHIMSLVYEGQVNKNLSVEAESAVSRKKTDRNELLGKHNNASFVSGEYEIDKINTTLKGEWEYMGRNFENNSIPYIKAATERYTLATSVDLFRDRVNVGVQYNLLKQTTFTSQGYNKRWGFDLKTKFKRYPNLYLSYKPFSTFRSYNDTFAIPQRPMFGEVWTVKATYQFRRPGVSHRFLVSYNKNKSMLDTQSNNSTMCQAGYMYFSDINLLSASIGWARVPVNDSTILMGSDTYFMNASFCRKLNKQLSLLLAQDIAKASFGIQRLSTSVGFEYSFESIPISIRSSLRHANFKENKITARKNIVEGQVGVNWQFLIRSGQREER